MKVNISKIKSSISRALQYCTTDVWNDQRVNWKVNTIKILNLSVRSFLNGDLQTKSCAMTYRTLLAVVPIIALLLALGRGFGLQDVIMQQLIQHFPSQARLLEMSFGFVESYLKQASGGIFVGVGIIFLFWTLISLLQSIEQTFNSIWQVEKGRSVFRMVTDYLAILIILPFLLVLSSGITIFMSSSLSSLLPYDFTKPAIETLIDSLGLIITWFFFTGTYILLPNTKVKFRNAILPGIIVGTAFQALQWLFISGQLYVAKYNAIYGSFSFLPLFLIWMQLVWLFTLIGAVLCYAMQNIKEFNYGDNIKNISISYRFRTTIVVMTIIAQRFKLAQPSINILEISSIYKLPINLVTPEINLLHSLGLINFIDTPGKELNERPVQPAIDINDLTVGKLIDMLINNGASDFINQYTNKYKNVDIIFKNMMDKAYDTSYDKKLIDITLN